MPHRDRWVLFIRRMPLFGLLCGAGLFESVAASPAPAVLGLDHVPLAVSDLDRAKTDFARLGFILKPGRPHHDGIRNAHVKFADHTEIELITARDPSDALATEYAQWLTSGDGPESWSLYSGDLDGLTKRLAALGVAPHDDGEIVTFAQRPIVHRLFFAGREPSPTDRPAYFAHPNTAYRLQGIWLTSGAAEQHLIITLGARRRNEPACAPFPTSGQVLSLPDGEVHLVPTDTQRPPMRSIVGATLLVRRLEIAKRILATNRISYIDASRCGHASIWIRPADAHGSWLELRQSTTPAATAGLGRKSR